MEPSGSEGREAVTIDPNHTQRLGGWREAEFDLDDLVMPPEPKWHRCGAVHCIDNGPWIGTLVCCIRQSGHDGGHTVSLGDEGGSDFWRESWD